jgi:hypothetical protein
VPIAFQCARDTALIQVQVHLKLCVCQYRLCAPEDLLYFKSKFFQVVCLPSAPQSLICFNSKFGSNCECANLVSEHRRTCSVASQRFSQVLCVPIWCSFSISSPRSRQLCVYQSRYTAPEALLGFKSHLCQLCLCQSRSSAPEALLGFKSKPAPIVCMPIAFQCAGGPDRFQVISCECANHVPVRRRPSSISSPSLRQLCVCQSRYTAPEALLNFKSNLFLKFCVSQSSSTLSEACVSQSSSTMTKALLNSKSKFVSSCVSANRATLRQRPSSISSPTFFSSFV